MKYSNPIDTNFHFISKTKEQFDEKIKSFINMFLEMIIDFI